MKGLYLTPAPPTPPAPISEIPGLPMSSQGSNLLQGARHRSPYHGTNIKSDSTRRCQSRGDLEFGSVLILGCTFGVFLTERLVES